jgi:hypothetical protein
MKAGWKWPDRDKLNRGGKALPLPVSKVAHRHTTDIDRQQTMQSKEWDRLGNVCVVRATKALEGDTDGYTREHRYHISDMFNSMATTNRTIRRVLEAGANEPESVDALVLARLQLECLYTVCLMLEGPQHVDCYTRDYWRKRYIEYLLMREETMGLPELEQLAAETPVDLIRLGLHFGVTPDQMATVELREIGKPLDASLTKQSIPRFPTPGQSIERFSPGDKRRMLERLHHKYVDLCSFAHGSGHANLFKIVFDRRSPHGDFLTEAEKEKRFMYDVVGTVYTVSFLSIAQSTAELTLLYPHDVELSVAVSNAWEQLRRTSFLTKAIWEIRTRSLLGMIS